MKKELRLLYHNHAQAVLHFSNMMAQDWPSIDETKHDSALA